MSSSPRLLLIDDDRLQARLVSQQLKAFRGTKYEMDWAATYEEGIAKLLQGGYAACLLDYQLGDRDGLELIREAKQRGCDVPIIFLTAESSSNIDIEAMNAGALDYLVKGEISTAMLERSMRYALKLSETLAELHQLATRDSLTGLLNRREMNRVLIEEVERAHRFQRSFSFVMLDLDHFKAINDKHGHSAGDRVLKEAAQRIQNTVRKVDRVARYGGEEIAVMLVELDQEAAQETAERMLEAFRSAPFVIEEQLSISVTASAGIATIRPDDETTVALALLDAADKALYAAKRGGRNRFVSAWKL